MKNIYVGTSGFQYKEWHKSFYPESVKKKDWLPYYAGKFNSVEMNSPFYRLPEASTFAKWRDEVPANFRFAIKGSRYVTHQKRLRDPEEPIERLFSRAKELRTKLGVVLWQFVERWPMDDERLQRLDDFCRSLQKHKTSKHIPQAFELRHKSWFNEKLYNLLKKYDYALVVNQSSKWPVIEVATASWTYFRFHGPKTLYSSEYSDKQLADWSVKARQMTPPNGDFFAYFNNDNGTFAPYNAMTLRDKLST